MTNSESYSIIINCKSGEARVLQTLLSSLYEAIDLPKSINILMNPYYVGYSPFLDLQDIHHLNFWKNSERVCWFDLWNLYLTQIIRTPLVIMIDDDHVLRTEDLIQQLNSHFDNNNIRCDWINMSERFGCFATRTRILTEICDNPYVSQHQSPEDYIKYNLTQPGINIDPYLFRHDRKER